jgi:hypothetical protein
VNIYKLLLALVVVFLAAFGAFALFGLIAAMLKYIILIGLIVLAGTVGYKALKRKSDDHQLVESNWADRELEKAQRLIESVKRGQLTK